MKIRVLFVCATNGVQSPIAEALLNALDSEHFQALSAGIERGEMHPLAVEVMKEIGVDLSRRSTKATDDVLDQRFDLVITMCDRSRSECPKFSEAEIVNWQFDDPLNLTDTVRQKRLFRALRDQIAQRIRLFALVQVRFAPVETIAPHDPRFQSDLVHS